VAGHGAAAAEHFGVDVAALEKAARTAPAFVLATPDSRGAAELAVLARYVHKLNYGCVNTGGARISSRLAIVWLPVLRFLLAIRARSCQHPCPMTTDPRGRARSQSLLLT
jgi:hypothetical protein